MALRISRYQSQTDKVPELIDITWDDLVNLLSETEPCDTPEIPCPGKTCFNKNGPAWSAADARTDADVQSLSLAVFEFDGLSIDQVTELAARIEPYRYIVHSTHSHDPPGDNRLRLVLAVSRPVLKAEWRPFWASVVSRLGLPADPAAKNESRIYFLRRAPLLQEEIFEVNEGEPLDVDSFLKPPDDDPSPAPVYELAALREVLEGVRKNKTRLKPKDPVKRAQHLEHAATLKRVLEGLPIAVPGDFVGETDLPRGRDAELLRVTGVIASSVPYNTPWDPILAILRPTLNAMSAPEGLDHWIKEAEDMYQRGMRKRADFDAANEVASKENFDALTDLWAKISGKTKAPETPSNEEDWRGRLRPGKDGEGYQACGLNASIILGHTEETKGCIRFNEVTKHTEIHGGMFAGIPLQVLHTDVMNWLMLKWGIQLKSYDVKEQIYLIARLNGYDPVKNYLKSLKWDGTPRIDTWLTDYCTVSTVNDDGEDISDYVREVGAKFLISAAARGLCPGEKVDTVLIFEGVQGIKKSTAAAVLGGKWFADTKLNFHDKDAKISAGSSWVIEIAELASLRKADVEIVKGFLSQNSDKFRPPYGVADEVFPRRCVFIGTCNPDDSGQYLSDPTGARRFWPVRCLGYIDTDGLKSVRDQLWAESVVRYGKGERWWLDAAGERVAASETANRTVQSTADMEIISVWWGKLQKKPESVRVVDVAIEALQIDPDKVKTAEPCIGRALKALGFTRKRVMQNHTRVYLYYPPKHMVGHLVAVK